MFADVVDQVARYGWAVTVGMGATVVTARGFRGLWRIGTKVHYIYEQLQPNSGTSMYDRLSKIEKKLGIDPPVRKGP